MTDSPKQTSEPLDTASDAPLDQTMPPIDQLQEDLPGDLPLDRTRPEMREVLGSEGPPERGARRGN